MPIVVLSGKQGSGRSSVAKSLLSKWLDESDPMVTIDIQKEYEFDHYTQALRVRLWAPTKTRKRRKSEYSASTANSEIDCGLDEYSFEKMFDLYLNTRRLRPGECADIILSKLKTAFIAARWKK